MFLRSPYFALALCVLAALAGCGGGAGLPALPQSAGVAVLGGNAAQPSSLLKSNAAPSAPSGTPSYTGVVSGIGLSGTSGFTANCGHVNFGGYGCIPVTTTNATIVGSIAVGAYFEVWGTVVPPNVTATYVVFSPTPFPSPSPSPTPVAGCAGAPALGNGVEYAAGWAPYSCTTSPWNLHVSSSPRYATNSSAVIATEFGSGNTQPVRSEEAGPYDYGHPVYYASASDPLVNLHCTAYCNTADNGGLPASMHIPAQARPAGGSDAHMAVIQPDGTEIDLWATNSPSSNWTSGATVTAQAIANCGNFVTGSGFTPTGPAATAGGACLGAGLLRANELASGSIGHALFLIAQCAVGWQYPAFPNASTNGCTSGGGPPLGGRLWYDVPDATTAANTNLKPWEKAILNALHDYGGYLEDDVSGGASVSGIAFLAESGEAPWAFGQTDPFSSLVSQGWSTIPVGGALDMRYLGASPWQPGNVNFAAHLHWLDPCSAHATC